MLDVIIGVTELCVIMQAKQSVQEAEKESIVKDVQDAFLKGLQPPDGDRRLRFVVSIDFYILPL